VLALDADRAGREAMLRAQRVAAGKRVRLRVVSMPEGEDPADMLAGEAPGSSGAERFVGLVDAAVDLPAFHVRTLLDEADLSSPAGRDRALDEVVPVLASMADSITREELAREVGDRLDADPALVSRRLAAAGRGGGRARPGERAEPETARQEPRILSAQERQEQGLLAMCIAAPADGREYLQRINADHLSSTAMRRARDWLIDHLEAPGDGLPREDSELADAVMALVARAQLEPASPEAMELSFLLLERSAIERRIAVAEANGGDPPIELQKQRAELAERIAHHQNVTPKSRK
jgi:DNA primase